MTADEAMRRARLATDAVRDACLDAGYSSGRADERAEWIAAVKALRDKPKGVAVIDCEGEVEGIRWDDEVHGAQIVLDALLNMMTKEDPR